MTILPFFVGDNRNGPNDVILKLQNTSKTLFIWFSDNQMKGKPDKCHFICSSSVKTSIILENKTNKLATVLVKNF